MTTNQNNDPAMSGPGEEWLEELEDLVAWDGEIYDRMFSQDASITGPSNYHESFTSGDNAPESVASDRPYDLSAPSSVIDEHTSFEYITSPPSSNPQGPSPLGQAYSWTSDQPPISTTATSPLLTRISGVNHESFMPLEERTDVVQVDTEEQILPGSSAIPFPTTPSLQLMNPFVPGSLHAFSTLDVLSSQAIASVGTQAEQAQVFEPIQELDHVQAIPMPRPTPRGFNSVFGSVRGSQNGPVRGTTMPRRHAQQASYNPSLAQSHRAEQISPIPSISPDARRRLASSSLARSNSRTSPTTNTFGWVSYQPDSQSNRLVPSSTDASQGRRVRGRVNALTIEQRRNAALMRIMGACSNCRKRRERCDPGTPCKACLHHFGSNLINSPCRDRLLSDLSKVFLSNNLGWHPTARPLDSFIALSGIPTARPSDSSIALSGISYPISLSVGFGPLLHVPVHRVRVSNPDVLVHDHVIYPWPPSEFNGSLHKHAVLPAVLTPDALSKLPETLDAHLTVLVTHHFRHFPLYTSPLRILREIHILFHSLPAKNASSRLLLQALKLLVLVHIGGDLTLPSPSTDPVLKRLVRASLPALDVAENPITPSPCFIRAQLGSVIPSLAQTLLKEVLSSLEQILLSRKVTEWPITVAVMLVVLLAIESMHYHAAKLPYHHAYDQTPASNARDRTPDDHGIESLLSFYSSCFSACHARLNPEWKGDGLTTTPEDIFVRGIREAVKNAGTAYLEKRATGEREDGDMGFFFDRLIARFLVLKP